jgi:hypothetical protein
MKERNSSSRIGSMDTLKTSAPQGAPELTEQERLPRGSALLLETILMLSRQIQKAGELETAKDKAASIEDMAGELIEKYNRQMAQAA